MGSAARLMLPFDDELEIPVICFSEIPVNALGMRNHLIIFLCSLG